MIKQSIFIAAFCLFSLFTFAQSASEVCALNIGSQIPSVKIQNTESETVDLNEVVSAKPTVLIFYRGGWCPYCTRHLSAVQKMEKEILDMGYQIVAVSPDRVKDLPSTMKKEKLNYELYSDAKYDAMKAMGIAFKPSEKRLPVYARVMKLAEKDVMVPVPAVFIIKDGEIQYRYVNPIYSSRLTNEMLLAALKSLK